MHARRMDLATEAAASGLSSACERVDRCAERLLTMRLAWAAGNAGTPASVTTLAIRAGGPAQAQAPSLTRWFPAHQVVLMYAGVWVRAGAGTARRRSFSPAQAI
jgi:hypothetical protein